MLGGNFGKGAFKRRVPAQPFIGYHSQGVLIAGIAWFPLNLFGSHIIDRSNDCFRGT